MSEPTPSRRRLRMPFLLLCGTGFFTFFAGLSSLVVVFISLVAGLGHGPFTVDGRQATKAEFWAASWPVLAVFGVLAFFAWVFVLAAWNERPRSREFGMVLWFVLTLIVAAVQLFAPIPMSDWIADIVGVVAGGAFALWYLYRKHSVVDYYNRLQQRADSK